MIGWNRPRRMEFSRHHEPQYFLQISILHSIQRPILYVLYDIRLLLLILTQFQILRFFGLVKTDYKLYYCTSLKAQATRSFILKPPKIANLPHHQSVSITRVLSWHRPLSYHLFIHSFTTACNRIFFIHCYQYTRQSLTFTLFSK